MRIGKISRSDTDILAAAAWGAVALMMLTSLAPVRKRMFGLFRICHFLGKPGIAIREFRYLTGSYLLGLVILVVALLFHMPRTALMG